LNQQRFALLCGSRALMGTILVYFLDNCENPSSLINEMEETSLLLQVKEEDQPMWMKFFLCFSVQRNISFLVNDKHSSGANFYLISFFLQFC
jgi:hypothetical protein